MSIVRFIVLACAAAFAATPAAAQMAPAHDMEADGMMPPMSDTARFAHVSAERLEFKGRDFRWQGQAWFGGDTGRIVFKSEGVARRAGGVEDGRHELLFNRPLSTYLDIEAGVRSDIDSRAGRSWAALGVRGMAPLFFDYEATAYASERGHAAARLSLSTDFVIVQGLVLQPAVELNLYSQSDPGRGIGSGLSDIEAGIRLRYEITRKFAPYIGVAYNGKYGETARFARRDHEDTETIRLVFGIRSWF